MVREMETVRRLAKQPVIKIICGVGLLVVLYNVLTSPFVVNPLAALFFAGAVPGTKVILTPNTILVILASVAGAVILTLAVMALVRHHNVRRSGERLLAGAPADHHRVLPTEAAAEETLYERPDQPEAEPVARRQFRWPTIDLTPLWRLTRQLQIIVQHQERRVGAALKTLAANAYRQLRQIISLTVVGLTWLLAAVLVAAELLIGTVKRYSIQLWIWAKPHLKRFDGWLETRYRALGARATRSAQRSDHLQVLATIYQQIRRGIRDYFR